MIADVKLLLEGPYNTGTGLMSDNLRSSGLLPNNEPYSAIGFIHNGGGFEAVSPSVLSVTGPNAIVDWVFLELRSSTDFTQTVSTRSALLQADGNVVDMDGVSHVFFNNVPAGNYYIVVRHRNHLGLMTPGSLPMSSSIAYQHDFSTGSAYGVLLFTDVQKNMGLGKFAMFECDFNQSGTIDAADRSIAWNYRNQAGYLVQDSNFDGVVDAQERSQVWNNRNKSTRIP